MNNPTFLPPLNVHPSFLTFEHTERTLKTSAAVANRGIMERIEKLEAEFHGLLAKGVVHHNLAFAKAGIALGAGCVIAPFRTSAGNIETHDFSGEDRILALLSAAYGRSISPAILEKLQHASEIWSRGDPCLASIYLAQLRIPRLDQEHQAWSLFLADRLIQSGYAPRDLAKALGFELPENVRKFDSDQPRDDHGRWTSGGGSGAAAGNSRGAGDGRVEVAGLVDTFRRAVQAASRLRLDEALRRAKELLFKPKSEPAPAKPVEEESGKPANQTVDEPVYEPDFPLPSSKPGSSVNIPGLPGNFKAVDITKGRSVTNYSSDLTQSEFESKLEALGWTKTPTNDPNVVNYSKDNYRYAVRAFSKSTNSPTADFQDLRSSSNKAQMKLRLRDNQ